MGSFISNNGLGHKSSNGSEYSFEDYANWRGYVTTKRPKRKMETKFIVFLFIDLLGVGWGFKTLIDRINNVVELALCLMFLVWGITRYIFYIIKQRQLIRKEDFEHRQREIAANKK